MKPKLQNLKRVRFEWNRFCLNILCTHVKFFIESSTIQFTVRMYAVCSMHICMHLPQISWTKTTIFSVPNHQIWFLLPWIWFDKCAMYLATCKLQLATYDFCCTDLLNIFLLILFHILNAIEIIVLSIYSVEPISCRLFKLSVIFVDFYRLPFFVFAYQFILNMETQTCKGWNASGKN